MHRHGWEGLAAFKLLIAVVFGAAVVLISRHRPRIARVLVVLGCLTLLLVVLHSRRMLDEGERKAHQQLGSKVEPERP